MTTPTYFTVVADYKSVVVDLASDVDADPQLGPVTARVTFTPVLRNGDVILATDASPRPTGFVAAPIVARIDTDGRLKLRVEPDGDRDDFANLAAFPATGNTAKVYFAINTQTFYRWNGSTYVETYPYAPVRLLADTALLELDSDLYYRVSFSEVVFNGGPGYIAPFTFQAPNTDTELNLIEVMRQPGQPASGITKIAPGAVRVVDGNKLQFSFAGVDIPDPVDVNIEASVIEDSGTTGRALIQSETAIQARSVLDIPGAISTARSIADLRDWDAVKQAQWTTRLGYSYTAGQSTISNSSFPFTSADVGKTVIVLQSNTDDWWSATITSVNSSGVAQLDRTAPVSTFGGGRVRFGFDGTTAINAALAEVAGDSSRPREVYLTGGRYRLSQLVVPNNLILRGTGSTGYNFETSNTVLQQLPGAEKDFVVFSETFTSSNFQWLGLAGLTNLYLFGPEKTVDGDLATVGNGVALRKADGTPVIVSDGCEFNWLHSMYFPENGYLFNGGVPLWFNHCRAVGNGKYGIDYVPLTVANTQAVQLNNYTCDSNNLGAVRFKGLSSFSPVTITNLKSEATSAAISPLYGGPNYQSECVILEDCDQSPIVINGLSHIRGGAVTGPGPSIVIRSATNLRPNVVFNAVSTRIRGTETVGTTADSVTLRDEVASVDIPQTVTSGNWPLNSSAVAVNAIKDRYFNNAMTVGGVVNGVNVINVSNNAAGSPPSLTAVGPTDSDISIALAPKGTGGIQIVGGTGITPRITPVGADTNISLNLQSKNAGTVKINSVDAVDISTAQTLTNKSMSGTANTFSAIPQSAVTNLTTDLAARELAANKGQANGYASLDANGKLPSSQLTVSAFEYQGAWDASANTPTLADGTGSAGDLYRVSTAGTRNLGSGSIDFSIGDMVIYSGSVWQKIDNTDAVASVNGYTGAVSLTKSDVGLGSVDNTSDLNKPISTATQSALDGKAAASHTHPQSDITNLTTDLAGKVPTSRTVNSKALSSDITLTQDDIGDGTTNKVFTGTEKTKLAGIATGATANSADATLLARANHTGTQTASTISDFATAADARITAAIGTTVQAYDADLAALALKTTPTGDLVGTTDSQALTNKDLTGAGNTFPTFNQNTTGSAATLSTGRTVQTDLASSSAATFNGSANITPGVTGTLPVANGGTGATTLTGLVKGSGTSALSAAVAGTDYVAPGGALGTPSSGTLTNVTGLPLTGLVSDTSTALGVGSLNVGHASDTTLTRSSAGVLAVEGDVLAFSVDGLNPDRVASGESTIPRRLVNINSAASGNGNLRLTYFTAIKTETITEIRMHTGSSAAVSPTLCRVGIYSIDGSGNLTLIASIANDTTLWIASSTTYTRSLSASFSKVRGTRYAVGTLVTGTTTAPNFAGQAWLNASESFVSPPLSAFVSGQTDLPATINYASLAASAHQHYTVLLP